MPGLNGEKRVSSKNHHTMKMNGDDSNKTNSLIILWQANPTEKQIHSRMWNSLDFSQSLLYH